MLLLLCGPAVRGDSMLIPIFPSLKGASVNDCAFNAKKEVDRVVEKLRNFQDVQNPVVEAISEDAQLASMAN